MRALIVDDEQHVIKAIKMLVPWQNYGISHIDVALDGKSATQKIKDNYYNIIFTDMRMPQVDGIQFLNEVAQISPTSKVIVISGYDDFTFTKTSIQHGAVDYILKPIKHKSLQDAVAKSVELWKKEEKQRLLLQKVNVPQGSSILSEIIESEVLTKNAFLMREKLQSDKYTLVMLTIWNEKTGKQNNREFLYRFEWMYKSLGFSYYIWNQKVVFLFTDHSHVINFAKDMELMKNKGYCVHMAISETYTLHEDLKDNMDKLATDLKRLNLKNGVIILSADKEQSQLSAQLDYTIFDKVKSCILDGNIELLSVVLKNWKKEIREKKVITYEQLILWRWQLNVFISKWSLQLDNCSKGELLWQDMEFYYGSILIDKVLKQSNDIFFALFESYANHSGNSIRQIRLYINNHYKENITLTSIANKFYLSKEHVSREFKKEIGINLSKYITTVRIDMAKKLLSQSNMKVKDIATQVGYDEVKYFYQVFKKNEGVSPNQYRKNKS